MWTITEVARCGPGLQGRAKPGLTLYGGGRDTFCQRWVVQPDGKKPDCGELKRDELEALGLKVVLAERPTTGWHVAPYPDEIIAKTVEALKAINPDYLIPMHCT